MKHTFTRGYLSIELGVKLSYKNLKKSTINLTKSSKLIEHRKLQNQIPPNLQCDQSNESIMDQEPTYPPSEHRDDTSTQNPIMDSPPDPVEIDLFIEIDTAEVNVEQKIRVPHLVDVSLGLK